MAVGNTFVAGVFAIATATTGVLSTLFLVVFFAGVQAFGPLNDAFIGITAILAAILAGFLTVADRSGGSFTKAMLIAAATAGAIVVAAGSILVMSRTTGFLLSGLYMAFGNALIGLWLLSWGLINKAQLSATPRLQAFGVITGAFMVIGLVAIIGMIKRADDWESLPRYVAYLAGVGAIGWIGVFPVWSAILGVRLVSR